MEKLLLETDCPFLAPQPKRGKRNEPSYLQYTIPVLAELYKLTVEDKYYTPLNSKYTGRSNPDMFGVVIHANIIAMILNEQYLDQMSETTAWLLAVLVCFLNVVVFSIIYYKLDKWYDGITKLIQLVEALILTFIIIIVFHYFDFKLNLTWTIIAVLFAGDSLEVYYGVLVNAWEKIEKKWLTN